MSGIDLREFEVDLLLQDLKSSSKAESFAMSIGVHDNDGTWLGSLVPVGEWVADDTRIITELVNWRSKFNRMFPTRTKVTCEGTIEYIKKSYLANPASIFFLIYTNDDRLVAHVGLVGLDCDSFELVNLVRGASGGSDELIYYAEKTLLTWGFRQGSSSNCFVEVMSYNWPAKNLHSRVGFEVVESICLAKESTALGVRHSKVSPEETNVEYTIQRMILTRAEGLNTAGTPVNPVGEHIGLESAAITGAGN